MDESRVGQRQRSLSVPHSALRTTVFVRGASNADFDRCSSYFVRSKSEFRWRRCIRQVSQPFSVTRPTKPTIRFAARAAFEPRLVNGRVRPKAVIAPGY